MKFLFVCLILWALYYGHFGYQKVYNHSGDRVIVNSISDKEALKMLHDAQKRLEENKTKKVEIKPIY